MLVVDDDEGLQETLQVLLEMEGYDVAIAQDGLDALAKLDHLSPDLILLDLMMPRMDGFEFVAELERRGRRGGIPIVVLTADGRAKYKAERVSAAGYLGKPFDVPELLGEMDRVLGGAA